ncbi:DNA polymerase I [Proteus mirabilis]|uniref:DNA-directed DNA polymerase n=1 Tax=Proteus mirabilis TaxID=584 RepID=A0A379GD33_PROMI|nr:DNA polymerase I [Proteus mirabilis]
MLLHQALYPQIEAIAPLKHVYHDIEMPLVPVLSRMERKGVLIDAQVLAMQSQEITQRLAEIEKETFALAGQDLISLHLSNYKRFYLKNSIFLLSRKHQKVLLQQMKKC